MNFTRKIKNKIKSRLNAAVRSTAWFNDEMFPDCKKFLNYKTFNTEVVNLGSTSGLYAFNYDGLPVAGANWALGHNPLMADEAVLKNYLSYLKPEGSTVIISLCAFSSLAGSYENDDDRYYAILYPNTIPHFSFTKQQRVKNMYNSPLRYFPVFALYKELKLGLTSLGRQRTFSEDEMETDAKRWIKGWLHEFSVSDFSAPLSLLNQDNITDAATILDRIVKLCREHNFRVVMTIPPMYHTLAEKFTPEARKMLILDLLGQMKENNVEFINYMDDADFVHNPLLFRNSFFLNEKGARLFTKRILTDIGLV